MKAIIKERRGVFLRDIPIPKPGVFDVLIKVVIAAYCRTDGYVAQNKIKTKVPLVLGHEFSGIIEKVGKKVQRLKKGDRVAIMPILPNKDGHYLGPMLGMDVGGAFAEYVVVPERAVYKIPDKLSFIEAAYLEPVTSSLAVLKAPINKKQRGFILGQNRIAKLTQRILDIYGFKSIKMIAPDKLKNIPSNSYDFAIETLVTTKTMSELNRIIKPGGIIILKSRQFSPVEISIGKIVQKDMKLFGTYYGDFQKSIDLLVSKKLKVSDIFGPALGLQEAVKILKGKIDGYEEKKIFFQVNSCAE